MTISFLVLKPNMDKYVFIRALERRSNVAINPELVIHELVLYMMSLHFNGAYLCNHKCFVKSIINPSLSFSFVLRRDNTDSETIDLEPNSQYVLPYQPVSLFVLSGIAKLV